MPGPRLRRRCALGVAGALLTLSGAACSTAEPSPTATSAATRRPLTSTEADRFAVARFNNYSRGGAPVEVRVPLEGGVATITGAVDFRTHRGYGIVDQGTGSGRTRGLIAWSFGGVGVHTLSGATLPSALPPTGWQARPLDQRSPLDATLTVLLNLAQDRPDNPQLLRQNGAEWVGSTTLDGVEVDLFTATPAASGGALTYYLDSSGLIHRVDLRIAGAAEPAVIGVGTGTAQPIPDFPPALPTEPATATATSTAAP